jgi:dTDP-4-dehydrorhamnose reductase
LCSLYCGWSSRGRCCNSRASKCKRGFKPSQCLKKVDGKLIHISTDFLFDGTSFLPYKESDPVSPIGVNGKTKRAGEHAVINSDIDSIVIRTSWLYSAFGNNFVKQCLNSDMKVMN